MGLLDSNIFRLSAKSVTLSGDAVTSNSYLNGSSGFIDVSNYQTVCFRVKSISSGVTIRAYGGVTSGFTPIPTYNMDDAVVDIIQSSGTFSADVSKCNTFAIYIVNGVSDGTIEVECLLKSEPLKLGKKPIQTIYSDETALSEGNETKIISLSSIKNLLSNFRFIVIYARFLNASGQNVTKTSIQLKTIFSFSDAKGATPKLQEEVTDESNLSSDWISVCSNNLSVRLDFSSAASAGDKVFLEVNGIR